MQWMVFSAICVTACSLPLTYVITRSRKHIVKPTLQERIDAEYSLLSMDPLASGFTAKAVSTRRLAMIKIIFARLSLHIWAMLKNARSYAAQKNSAITRTLLTHRNLTPVTTRISWISMITKTLKSAIGLMRVVPWGSAGSLLQYAQSMQYSWSNCLSKQ